MYSFITDNIKVSYLTNGLTVYSYNDPQLEELYANYTINYGSNDLNYQVDGVQYDDVMGIAHYLEHLMFADNNNDYFDYFTKLGTSSNAYTSFTQTSYLFTTSSNYQENLKLLIEMVQTLKVDDLRIRDEFGVIKEEIEMYNGKPNYLLQDLLFEHACNSNYQNNIAGTVESIEKITNESLFRIFKQFYHPCNATLFVAGNIDFNLISYLESIQVIKEMGIKPVHNRVKEELQVKGELFTTYSSKITDGQMMIGVKMEISADKEEMVLDDIVFELVLNWLTSNINTNYQVGVETNIINESLSGYHLLDKEINMLVMKIRSENHLDVIKYIRSEIKSISKEMLDTLRKKKIGSEIRLFNNSRTIVEYSLDLILREIDLEFYFETLYNMNVDKLHSHLLKRIEKIEVVCQKMIKEERG